MFNIIDGYYKLDKELDKANDRASAIIAGTFLDELLKLILIEYFVPDNKKNNDELFSGYGPLSTFRARTVISYRLGLISKREYTFLSTVRSIRNKFAHDMTICSFNDSSIRSLCTSISLPLKLISPRQIPVDVKHVKKEDLKKATENEPYQIFRETIFYLHCSLLARYNQVMIEKKQVSPKEFRNFLEILDTMISESLKLIKIYKEKTKYLKKRAELIEKSEEYKKDSNNIKLVDGLKIDIEKLDEFKNFKSSLKMIIESRECLKKLYELNNIDVTFTK